MNPRPPSVALRIASVVLTALAATTLDDSMTGGLEPRQSAVLLLVYLALVGGAQGLVGVVLGRRDGKQPIRLALFQAALAFLFLLPVLTEPLTRAAAAVSYPEGALLLWGVRNIGLGAAAFSRWEVGLRLGAFASACQVIFAFTLGGAGAAPGLTAAYVCTLALWLCGYAAARTGNGLGAKRLHYFGSGAVAVLVLGAFAAAHAHHGGEIRSLEGWFPSSGGSREKRADARGGVNDGEDQVAALDRAETVGFTDSDVFIDTPEDSLLDVANDIVGEPQPMRTGRKAVSVSTDRVIEARTEAPRSLAPSREFSTMRQTPKQRGTPASQAPTAMYYVRGRTPAHLGITAYSRFDGVSWHTAPLAGDELGLTRRWGGFWFDLFRPSGMAALKGEEHYEVRVARKRSTRIPAPAHVVGLQVRSVDRADMFRWSHEGLLAMNVPTIPPGTTVHLHAKLPDGTRLAQSDFGSARAVDEHCREVPSALHDSSQFRKLANQVALSSPSGWQRVEAAVRLIRQRCTLDSKYRPPADCPDPVLDFLFEARRGPNYLFATSTALLLRELGFSTRLVSGFYADPTRFDEKSGQTLVAGKDLHFWPQVLYGSRPGIDGTPTWMNVEPTPGRMLLQPRASLQERILALAAAVRAGFLYHWPALAVAAILLMVGWGARWVVCDAVLLRLYRLVALRRTRQEVLGALWVIDWRCRLIGRRRPANRTLRFWLKHLDAALVAGPTERLLAAGECLLYGSSAEAAAAISDGMSVRAWCDQSLADTCLKRLRQKEPPRKPPRWPFEAGGVRKRALPRQSAP